ncbi:MAG: acetyl-CoA carboxylase biotin carboxyl carrier protein [Clostridiales bacterium]|jgi:acetyl-CoA carboxylase biotin carboxyl carrier protein|nr:acetyl-CoA carboxylase biotin carboxyl carrier protein [Clostridiales bacterium]
MDVKIIKALAKILDERKLSLIEVTQGDVKIKLERNCETPAAASRERDGREPRPAPARAVSPALAQSAIDFNKIKEVRSPMVGVFYAAPSPGSPPFVKVGDKVKKGTVLCIIEAMKLMNEICSEYEGEIVDICVENEQIVEYGQTLFKIY